MTDSSPSLPLDDPTALARFGRLEVIARSLVEGYLVGQHRSPFKGSSVEFAEHRQYVPGDEIRHIDWRAYGKTERHYVKQYEDETNLRCYLLVDASGSMAYAGKTLSKLDYARQLAAALAYMLVRQRDAVGLVTFDTAVRTRIEPSTSHGQLEETLGILGRLEPGGETSLGAVCSQLVASIPRRSLIVLLSDGYDKPAPLGNALGQFRHAKHDVMLLQVVAPEEETFPFERPTQFRSLERAGHRVLVDPARQRAEYLERYRDFQQSLEKMLRGNNVDYARFTTNDPYATALGAFLSLRRAR